jgi:3-deoxy-manno-octulosonate cytidylyltransferase (CMP-KDO synthetase)
MRTIVVIPARFASTRLPAKPLLRETGKFLIQHVVEQALAARRPAAVLVATDDERIRDAVQSFGGTAIMTRADHPSGTDRIAEVVAARPCDIVINVQGDEPQFEPTAIDQLAEILMANPAADVATLATPIRDAAMYDDPNCVKVVCDDHGRALYFSRAPIPWYREGRPDFAANPPAALLHVGAYAYRRAAVLRIAASPPHRLEQAEKLEQLRVLGAGGVVQVGVVMSAHRGVDTPADYAAFVRAYQLGRTRAAA